MHWLSQLFPCDEPILVLIYSLKLFGKLIFLCFVALEAYQEAYDAALEQISALEVNEILFDINDFIFLDLWLSHLGTDPGVLQ